MTAKDLGQAVGVEPNRLYYHLRLLEAAELIAVVGRRAEGRMAEKIYAPAGGNLGDEIAGEDPIDRAVFFGSVLDATRAELTDLILDATQDPSHPARYSVLRSPLVATEAEVDNLWRAIQGLVEQQHRVASDRAQTSEVERPDV